MKNWTKNVAWVADSTVAEPSWADLGKIHTDSAHNPTVAAEETSEGNEVYAGTQDVYEFRLYEETQYDDLKAIADADGTVDLQFTNADATEDPEVETGFSVMVHKIKNFTPRTRQAYSARFVRTTV